MNQYLMDYWTIEGTWKIPDWSSSEAHSLHSYFPLYENKREHWIQSKSWLERCMFRNTMFKICFYPEKVQQSFFLAECVHIVINLTFNVLAYLWYRNVHALIKVAKVWRLIILMAKLSEGSKVPRFIVWIYYY